MALIPSWFHVDIHARCREPTKETREKETFAMYQGSNLSTPGVCLCVGLCVYVSNSSQSHTLNLFRAVFNSLNMDLSSLLAASL